MTLFYEEGLECSRKSEVASPSREFTHCSSDNCPNFFFLYTLHTIWNYKSYPLRIVLWQPVRYWVRCQVGTFLAGLRAGLISRKNKSVWFIKMTAWRPMTLMTTSVHLMEKFVLPEPSQKIFLMALKGAWYAERLMISACFLRLNRFAFLRCRWQVSEDTVIWTDT